MTSLAAIFQTMVHEYPFLIALSNIHVIINWQQIPYTSIQKQYYDACICNMRVYGFTFCMVLPFSCHKYVAKQRRSSTDMVAAIMLSSPLHHLAIVCPSNLVDKCFWHLLCVHALLLPFGPFRYFSRALSPIPTSGEHVSLFFVLIGNTSLNFVTLRRHLVSNLGKSHLKDC